MLTTVTTKGQVTIPKAIRDFLRIQPNDRVDFVVESGQVVVRAVKTLKDLRGVVTASGPGDFETERARAKAAVGKRVSTPSDVPESPLSRVAHDLRSPGR